MEKIQTKLPRIEAVMMAEGIELIDKGSLYIGLCPFHADRNPSMVIYKTNNHFYCFGCGKSGDAIGFIMKYKDKSFNEALAYLNIRDYKNGYKAKKKRLIDMIAEEEKCGIDVRSKYGSEFIDTLLAKEIIKLSNPINNLQNIVKVNKNDQVLADKLIALANSAVDTIIYDE